MMKELTIESVRVKLETKQHVVILKEVEQECYLFIWVAHPEAYAIAVELQGTVSPRPLMHDLFNNTMKALGAGIVNIVISDLFHEVFYSFIVFDIAGKRVEVDARPSDAIAIAVRARVPIYVEESVLDSAGVKLDPESPLPNQNTGPLQ